MSILLALLVLLPARADSVDLLIRGGTVYDGSGGPARRVDVGIRGERIVFVGNAARTKLKAGRTINAARLIVSPGFIDPHTHSFEGLPNLNETRRKNIGALMQGVTTVVTGADGRGPLEPARVLAEADKLGIGTNTYTLTGFGTVRSRVMGNSSAPASPAQIDSMRALIARAMSEGAFGVGSGLFYAPQSYATTEEVIAVLKGATPYGGVYDTHQRDESSYTIGLLNSVREAIRIGRETGLITNIGHVKALGVDVWGDADSVLALMREERARGHMVVADQYPWTASGTSLVASLVPRWAESGGRDSLKLRIADPETRKRMAVEMTENLRRRGGDSTLLLTSGPAAARPYVGKTLKQVAEDKKLGPVDAALELISTVGDMSVASFNMIERDIETFMKDPYVMTSSDGSGGHPRLYGTYPRKIRRYVLDKPVITMERMVRASSGQVAEVYGIPERGLIKEGYYADVDVFDPRTIREQATYVAPEKLSVGMRWVFVNGKAAVANGVPTGALAGKGIRKPVRPAGGMPGGGSAAFWNSATIYFLLTDRFENGTPRNDRALGRAHDGAVLRSFEGGDLAGLLQRIEAGYFDSLGVDAIWMTPFVEQVHGSVDEGTGKTYGYHGYWTRDWTAVDPALGSKDDLRAVVDAAHRHGIRVLMDAVINHTGPETAVDPRWPDDWVRREPNCTYRSYATTVTCNLVKTLPDILTERDAPVELPADLLAKWQREGRRDAEVAGLDGFFRRTGYPRAPRYYVIKWLTDWVREFGFDGYRVDTAKHFEETVSADLKKEASEALREWRRAHPALVGDTLPFYMVGEVYGYAPNQGRQFDFGDRKVDFFAHGYDALINFGFKAEAHGSLDSLYTRYGSTLHGALAGEAILNYVSSHDDGGPYDLARKDPYGAGTRLLLAPGGAQIYYGDELARSFTVPGAQGDANLRSFMNWGELARGGETSAILAHWRKLGKFRQAHRAVGAGEHRTIQASPLVFSRTLGDDRVVVALDQGAGAKTIPVAGMFEEGATLVDGYSGARGVVRGGTVTIDSEFGIVLLGEAGWGAGG